MIRPSPNFIVTLTGLVLLIVVVVLYVATWNHNVAKSLEPDQMCVSTTGHKKVPCP